MVKASLAISRPFGRQLTQVQGRSQAISLSSEVEGTNITRLLLRALVHATTMKDMKTSIKAQANQL